MRNPVTIGGARNPVTIRGPRNPVTILGAKNPVTIMGVRNPVTIVGGGGTGDEGESVTMDVVINFSDGDPEELIDEEIFNGGLHGANWGGWVAKKNGVDDQPNTYSYIEDHAVQLPFDISCGDDLFNGSEGQGLTFDLSGEPADYDCWHWALTPGKANVVAMYLIKSETVLSGSPTDYYNDTLQIAGANFSICQMRHNANGTRQFNAHSEADLGAIIPYDGSWVMVWIFNDASNNINHTYVQKVTQNGSNWEFGDLLGASVTEHTPPIDTLNYIRLQTYLRPAANGGTGSIKVKLLAFREGTSFPAYHIGIPAPVVTATQSLPDEITVTWTSVCQIFDIYRNTNGGTYSLIQGDFDNNGTHSYVDGTVTEGNTYTYRVVAKIVDESSPEGTSNSVTVDNTYTPAAGIRLWLKADSLALSDNDPVATWNDSSGLGNSVTQGTAGARPTYKTNILNGKPVVRGDGGDHLSRTGVVTSSELHTMIIVLKRSAANSAVPFYNGNTAANGWGFFQDGSGLRSVLFGGAGSKTAGTPSATDFEVWTTSWNGTNSAFWINGTENLDLTDPSIAPAGAPSGDTFVMGLNGSNQWSGDIAEILIWDNVLSTSDRQIAEDFLGAKYGITITH